jgi:hypothetical protein
MGFIKKNSMRRTVPNGVTRSISPRICMPTWRNFTRKTFRCSLYEAQDVLAEIDQVDFIDLDMSWGARFDEYWLRTPLYHDATRKLIFVNPGLKKVRLNRNYDVFIAVCCTYWDVPYVNAIARWRDHCKISICWIDELWVSNVPGYKYWLPLLDQFDYVFIGSRGTVSALSQARNRPCYWLPGGVDAFRFSPFPDPPARVIDVYSIGRRSDAVHHELLNAAEQGGLFYVHDTCVNPAANQVHDYQQHRNQFANIAKRSRYFMVGAAKSDAPDETRGQVEVGYRYYEGAAAGTVMVGEAPNCEAYAELFGWPDAVLEIQPDGSDVMAVLADLGSDRERMTAISRRNAKEALLRHDWVYRWKEMFRVAGIDLPSGTAARERRLKDLADLAASVDLEDAATTDA